MLIHHGAQPYPQPCTPTQGEVPLSSGYFIMKYYLVLNLWWGSMAAGGIGVYEYVWGSGVLVTGSKTVVLGTHLLRV